jgi:beta-lactamase regulating signal transducer with metallopeptidase domain
MIAAWMFYCSISALGLTFAGLLAERLLLAGRAPVRVVWVGALLASLALPAIVFRVSTSPTPAPAPVASAAAFDNAASEAAAPTRTTVAANAPRVVTVKSARDWRAMLPALDMPLLIAWAVLSAALALSFGGGFVTLAWMRRRWTRRDVQGIPVYVSHRTGPAVVGAMSPAIVVPEWALALDPEQLGLMLRHEREHLGARDGQLLIAAQIALIAMPWNLALWWQVISLRVAVEMDCDARVLRHADARSYGELLLEVARPHRGLNLAGMIAFAERATQLERRIRVLKRHRVATSREKAIAATGIALLALTAAWVAPHPATPLHAAVPTQSAHTQLPTLVLRDVAVPVNVEPRTNPVMLPVRKPATRPATPRVVRVECANDTSVVGSTYRFMFDGISLSRDNESKACEVIARLVDEQLAEDAVAEASAMSARSKRMAIQSARDANLGSLLKTDADRATFAANTTRINAGGGGMRSGGGGAVMTTMMPPGGGSAEPVAVGGRGARGGFVGDTLVVARARGSAAMTDSDQVKLQKELAMLARTGGAIGTVTRTMSPGNSVTTISVDTANTDPSQVADVTKRVKELMATMNAGNVEMNYRRLFDGIALSPDDEAQARKILGDAQQEMGNLAPTYRPGIRLRINRNRGIAQIVAGADSSLLELVPNEADRAKLRARLVVVPQ